MNRPLRRLLAFVLAYLCFGCTDTVAVAASESATHTFSAGGGLTRDTLAEAAEAPRPPARRSSRSKRLSSSHRSSARARSRRPTVVVAKPARPPRRNPVVSFVYWWNGWVIRTFHTKFGTVMLKRVGAKT